MELRERLGAETHRNRHRPIHKMGLDKESLDRGKGNLDVGELLSQPEELERVERGLRRVSEECKAFFSFNITVES